MRRFESLTDLMNAFKEPLVYVALFMMMSLPVCPQSHIQSTSDRIQFNDLQSLLCATLQVRRHT